MARRHPHPVRGGSSQRNVACVRLQRQRLIVIAAVDRKLRAGTNTAVLQKFQQAPVAFIDATYLVTFAFLSLREQEQTTSAATGRAFQFANIPVRASAAATQFS